MALLKEIILPNGVPTNYHRIVSINKITNRTNLVEVASYISKEQRDKEIAYYENHENKADLNVLIETNFYEKEYNETDTIKDTYDYLKTLDEFSEATDI